MRPGRRRHGSRSFELCAGRVRGALVWPAGALEPATTIPFRPRSFPPASPSHKYCPSKHACDLALPPTRLRRCVAAGMKVGVWYGGCSDGHGRGTVRLFFSGRGFPPCAPASATPLPWRALMVAWRGEPHGLPSRRRRTKPLGAPSKSSPHSPPALVCQLGISPPLGTHNPPPLFRRRWKAPRRLILPLCAWMLVVHQARGV